MAASGDGKGGRSITSTSSYQTLFEAGPAPNGSGSDGGPVTAYSVKPAGEDALVQVTYATGLTRVFNAPNGEVLPITVPYSAKGITKVEAKGETGIGIAIYGNVLVP
jgi:hypothetical protein